MGIEGTNPEEVAEGSNGAGADGTTEGSNGAEATVNGVVEVEAAWLGKIPLDVK